MNTKIKIRICSQIVLVLLMANNSVYPVTFFRNEDQNDECINSDELDDEIIPGKIFTHSFPSDFRKHKSEEWKFTYCYPVGMQTSNMPLTKLRIIHNHSRTSIIKFSEEPFVVCNCTTYGSSINSVCELHYYRTVNRQLLVFHSKFSVSAI